MTTCDPKDYFDLSKTKHAALFEGVNFVWEVIPKIGEYLKTLPLGIIEIEIPEGVTLVNPELISIGKGTVIEPGAYIKGPCVIGRDCQIRHGAYIRGQFLAGDRCVIGHATEIKNSAFLDDVHAAHFNYVGDSFLGNNVNLGAGTRLANLKLTEGEIKMLCGEDLVCTGVRKLGAILGDGVQTGCNSVTNPGTLMGKNSACYPCTNFGGIVSAGHVIRPEVRVVIK
jgi:UDP-N-acetylglucosamine diphosphorylase / glucose-1-phosphate thymidylyltransferase / UDP-N-acetylgalactosamine diphosphorylase / glucosamine-1-phosphate N-acetyltransferase / galactosamine-1-phosphate N-acetyltransferase